MKRIIGIDCSTNHNKLGICRATLGTSGLVIEEVNTGTRDPVDLIHSWIQPNPVLLAFDAPLGWPDDLGRSLSEHSVGEAISVRGHQLFRRATDRYVKNSIGKQSLDVGADKIARTALWTLSFLKDLGEKLGKPIPLAWSCDYEDPVAAIEVYPAATLMSRRLALPGYKQKENLATRSEILLGLVSDMTVSCNFGNIVETDDALDSMVCALAGCDFLKNRCVGPEDLELARKESWIWFARQKA